MTKYQNSSISLNSLMMTASGPVEPLCNSCKTRDCTNQIEKKKVSVNGVNREYKLIIKSSSVYGVVSCDGYSL